MTKVLRKLLVEALDTATPTLRDLAQRAGLTYHAVRRYRLGDRTPGSDALKRLANTLRAQARHLRRVAERLEQEAGDAPRSARPARRPAH